MFESICPGAAWIAAPVIDGRCVEHYIESLLPQVAAFRPHAYVPPVIRFLGYADRSAGPNGCWPWTGVVHPQHGEGTIYADGRQQKAHRWAYEHFIGPLPSKAVVEHTCHTGSCTKRGADDPHSRCVNPRHLAIRGAPQRYAYTCARCGEETIKTRPVKSSMVFCSMACRSGGRTVTKTCPVCGKEFTVARSNGERYQTCSWACKNVDAVYVNCERCGKPFPDDTRQGWNRRYCSEACRRPPLMVPCANCGKEFRKAESQTKKRFCSIACVRQFMGETQLEARMRIALERLGVGFVQEFPFRRWSIDFAIPEYKIAIEADGDYWHTILAERDAKRDARMGAAGWTVVRFGETEVYGTQDLGRLILDRVHAITGLELADLTGPAVTGSRQQRPGFGLSKRSSRPMKEQGALWGNGAA